LLGLETTDFTALLIGFLLDCSYQGKLFEKLLLMQV